MAPEAKQAVSSRLMDCVHVQRKLGPDDIGRMLYLLLGTHTPRRVRKVQKVTSLTRGIGTRIGTDYASRPMNTDILTRIRTADEAKRKALSGLHKELGYASARDLAAAIVEASGSSPIVAAARQTAPTAKQAGGGAPTARRDGRRIDPATKQQIVAALKAGEPGARVAKQFGVSYPTIHNWKTELGLVKPRSGGRKSAKK
jgi:hypothetical protein